VNGLGFLGTGEIISLPEMKLQEAKALY